MLAEPTLGELGFIASEIRHGFPEHYQESIDLFRLGGIADIGAVGLARNGPERVDDEAAPRIEESEIGQAGILGAELGLELSAPGVVKPSLVAALLHIDPGNHEMPGEDGLDGGILDKPIEAFAPPSPRGVENQPHLFVLRGRILRGPGNTCCAEGGPEAAKPQAATSSETVRH